MWILLFRFSFWPKIDAKKTGRKGNEKKRNRLACICAHVQRHTTFCRCIFLVRIRCVDICSPNRNLSWKSKRFFVWFFMCLWHRRGLSSLLVCCLCNVHIFASQADVQKPKRKTKKKNRNCRLLRRLIVLWQHRVSLSTHCVTLFSRFYWFRSFSRGCLKSKKMNLFNRNQLQCEHNLDQLIKMLKNVIISSSNKL